MEIDLPPGQNYRIAVVSDTHGKLSRGARRRLKGVDLILHAGDIDRKETWEELKKIAPMVAAKGNMDWGPWARDLHPTELVRVGNHWIYILHDLYQLDLDPQTVGIEVVISGHTHRSRLATKNGITYLNPGSASFPRGSRSASLALIVADESGLDVRLVSI